MYNSFIVTVRRLGYSPKWHHRKQL